MEIKSEADSNECLHYDRQIVGMFVIFHVLLSLEHTSKVMFIH